MFEKVLDQTIYLKEYMSEKDYKDICKLNEIISLNDKTNLKLELDYKLNRSRNSELGLKNINELLYYIDGSLAAYIGISSFGSNIGEINGMTNPDFRRKGIFKKLFELAIEGCRTRNFDKLLLIADGESSSGIEFIKAASGIYDFSEYRMKLIKKPFLESLSMIKLRKVGDREIREIGKQTEMVFNNSTTSEDDVQEDKNLYKDTFVVELKEVIIGKIEVDYINNSAFIFGFMILSDYRGKGYGKATLKGILRLLDEKNIYDIELDVECKNSKALNLYKNCGFEEKSVMNYYKYNI